MAGGGPIGGVNSEILDRASEVCATCGLGRAFTSAASSPRLAVCTMVLLRAPVLVDHGWLMAYF